MRGALVLAAALAGAAAPALAAEQTILPGYWESQNKVGFPINDESTSRQCITAAKVREFLSGPSTRKFRCTYTRSQVGGGRVEAAGSCVDKNGLTSAIAVKGSYTPESFALDADVRVNVGGVPIPISASTKATRISDQCPAE